MSEVTRLLSGVAQGDAHAAGQLLPLVYEELRKLAATRMAVEAPGNTLDATALVHEAYLRLVGDQQFDGRGHFFAAAAEAMRRILVDHARRKQTDKHGGHRQRVELPDVPARVEVVVDEQLLALDSALTRLAAEDPVAARVVELRHFAGLSLDDVAAALGLSRSTAHRHWTYARAWLRDAVSGSEPG